MFYDARGQAVRTRQSDGSEQRVVFGVPARSPHPGLANPGIYAPTPWEAYTYDANDNAGRTHGTAGQRAYRHHWNTPASIVVDALGRTRLPSRATAPGQPETRCRGSRTSHSVPLRHPGQPRHASPTRWAGIAFRYTFDLAKRRWRVDSIDAGRRDTVLDASAIPSKAATARAR